MLLLNFSHPLTPSHLARISALLGSPVARVIDVPTHFDHAMPFADQVRALVERVGFSSEQWQTERFVVNPPALAPIACLLVAELHGRTGYFPSLVRLRPEPGAGPPRYEPAEVLHLQSVRDSARAQR